MERERKIVIRATYISYNSVTVIYFFSAKPVAGNNNTKQMIPVYLQMVFFGSNFIYIFKGYIQAQVAHLFTTKHIWSLTKVWAQQRQKRAMNKERG